MLVMTRLDAFLSPTAWDYDALLRTFSWAQDMAATPQDPAYHAEGDVWTHSRMVCEALVQDEAWPGVAPGDRRMLLIAALLHDMAKPPVTFTDEEGRIRSPGHAVRGEGMARRLLWELEEPFTIRETVAALVRNHMQPRYLPLRSDPRRRLFAISHQLRCDHLALLARADARGRISPDLAESLTAVQRFLELCTLHECVDHPRRFTSDHARFLYFRGELDDPDAVVPPPAGPTLTLMSGLPGSGKDTWVAAQAAGLPVISLDQIRAELGISPKSRNQKRVRQVARQRALRWLEEHTDFIWNSTNLGRRQRQELIDLAAPYDARIRIVYADASPALLHRRNEQRSGVAIVPRDVIERMTHVWQPPALDEAHEIIWVLHDGAEGMRAAS